MVNLSCTQSWHAVVGGGPATTTWHDGETPSRPCAAQRPYRARLASKASAVMWWEHVGATVVAKELRGRKARSSGRWWRRRRCAAGSAMAEEGSGEWGSVKEYWAEPCVVSLCARQHTVAGAQWWPTTATWRPSPSTGRPHGATCDDHQSLVMKSDSAILMSLIF
jgi:hypothetical protein